MQLSAEGFADIVTAAIKAATEPLKDRITGLEQRLATFKGEKGDPGPQGERGERGERGEMGGPGPAGEKGLQGEPGPRGPAGEHGQKGADGKDGTNGQDGKDGVGLVGPQGEKGMDGKNGLDGLGFDDYSVSFDGQKTITLTLGSGERKREWAFRVPASIYRGVWREGEYEGGDQVTHSGSMWTALRTTTQRPGSEPKEGEQRDWVLSVKKGNDGRNGKDGERGEKGDKGPAGDRGPERW